jgi:hypothetical protein
MAEVKSDGKTLAKVRIGNRRLTKAAFLIAQKFGSVEVKDKPEELKTRTTPPEITKPIELKQKIADPLLNPIKSDLVKQEELSKLAKELKAKTKVALVELATEKKYPKKQWENLNKPDLINYLIEKLK